MEDTSLSDFLEAGDEAGEASPDGSMDDDAAPDGSEAGEARDAEGQDGETPESGPPAEGAVDSPTSDPETTRGAGDARLDPADPTIEPAASTSHWRASQAACESCGADVRRLWRTDSGMVCPDCVSW